MRKIFTLLAVVLSITMATAQTRTITGRVTDKNGLPVEGASVQIKGSTVGTSANQQGDFTISAKTGDVLVVSALNFNAAEITVANQNALSVTLESKTEMMDEVIVTSMGITREKKALGYAIQEVSGANLSQTTEQNVLNSLSGKVSGVQITGSSGAVGASSRIVLRGNSSFGDNQPLFIVDGTPVSNYTTSVGANGSVDFGNAISEIDPNNIESVSVLKGANAAAIYGSRAANGVIIITTKTGKGKPKGIGLSYSGAVTFDKPYILPKMQNKYGQGSGGSEYDFKQTKPGDYADYQQYAEEESFSYYDGNGNGVNDDVDESWGPRLDVGLKLPQFNSPIGPDGNRIATPWISHPNNLKDFFRTGSTVDHNVAMTSNTDKSSIRLSLSNQTQKGAIPNTDQKRNTVDLNTSFKLTDKLVASAILTYVNTKSDNLPGDGYTTNNVMQSIGGWFGRQVDMQDLKANWNKEFENGYPYNWNSSYHDNPYFNANKNLNSRNKDRIFGNVSLSYEFSKWFKLLGRVGDDWSYDWRKRVTANKGNETLTGPGSWGGGDFRERKYYQNELTADVLLNGQGKISNDFSLSYMLGASYNDYKFQYSLLGADQLTVPDFYTIGNVKGSPVTDMITRHSRYNSAYGQASLGYKGWIFLDITARNDWNSTLPKGNWSYFYPSASLSWIFTDALNISSNTLSYGKLRASWAQVGKATDPYQTIGTYVAEASPFDGVTLYHNYRTIPPANLKPESVKSTEFGLDLGLFNNRLGLDITYYDKITTNQIMNVSLSGASGFNNTQINAGEIENKGVELQLRASILRSNTGLNWDMNVNWAKNKNTVNKLYTDPQTGQKLTSYPITSAWSTTVDAIPGEAFGVIRGTGFLRDPETNAIIVNSIGLPRFTSSPKILGNINPDWVGGINNSFSYKNFNLSFLVDFRMGGDIFSVTDWFGAYAGVLEKTAVGDLRENGVIMGQNVQQGDKVVKMGADGKYVPNDIRVGAADYFQTLYSGRETAIINGSYIKFRELVLGYTFPSRLMDKLGWIKGANISLVGRNLALLYTHKSNTAHIDPETGMGADNLGLGIEQYQIPSSRSVGLRLNLNF